MSAALAARMEEVLAAFGVDVRGGGKALTGPCPVHGGDNATAFAVYPEGNWNCWTRYCHEDFCGDALGLVRGLMSAKKGRRAHYLDAVDWARSFLGKLPAGDPSAVVSALDRAMDRLLADPPELPGVDPAAVRARLVVPSLYFAGRGFDPSVLSEFMVGELVAPPAPESRFYHRAIIPVLGADGTKVVGYTCRSFSGRCDGCRHWHPPGPCRPFPKWRHVGPRGEDHFPAGDVLFGYHAARSRVLADGVVVLVESPGDTFALRAAGVEAVCGLFGTSLSDGQVLLLENSGAMTVVVATNNDDAGRDGARRTAERLGKLFRVRVKHPHVAGADWAETSADGIREAFDEWL